MAQPPADVSEDDCLPEYRHLFHPDLLQCSRELPVPGQRLVLQRLQDCDGHRHLGHLQRVSRALREVLPGPWRGDREHHCNPGHPGAGAPSARRLCQGGRGCDDAAPGCGVGPPEHPRQQPCPRPHQWDRGVAASGQWTARCRGLVHSPFSDRRPATRPPAQPERQTQQSQPST